jgi:hypothetical protein
LLLCACCRAVWFVAPDFSPALEFLHFPSPLWGRGGTAGRGVRGFAPKGLPKIKLTSGPTVLTPSPDSPRLMKAPVASHPLPQGGEGSKFQFLWFAHKLGIGVRVVQASRGLDYGSSIPHVHYLSSKL